MRQFVITDIRYAESPGYRRIVWSDGHRRTYPEAWTGFYRGVEAGRDAEGEFERLASGQPSVADAWILAGGTISPFDPELPVRGEE